MFAKYAPSCMIAFSQTMHHLVWLPRHSLDYLLKLLKILRPYSVNKIYEPTLSTSLIPLIGSSAEVSRFFYCKLVTIPENWTFCKRTANRGLRSWKASKYEFKSRPGIRQDNLRTEIKIVIENTSTNKSGSLLFIHFFLRRSSLTQGTNLINRRRHHFWSSLTCFRSNLSLCGIPCRWQVHNSWRSCNSNDILFLFMVMIINVEK